VSVSGAHDVLIALTDGQVVQVLRDASGRQHRATALPEFGERDIVTDALLADDSYSRSVLRALQLLHALPGDCSGRVLTEIAREVSLSPSTAYRYMQTWMAAGLVEQHPSSRRYRRSRTGEAKAKQPAKGGAGAG